MNPNKLLEKTNVTSDRSGVATVIYAMSEQSQSELSQIGEMLDDYRWKLGNIANSIKAEVEKNHLEYKNENGISKPVSFQDVYVACSILTNRKVSARTIAYYAMLEEFYPKEIRDKYEPLPMTHFAFAHQFKDRYQEILDLAYSRYELTNRMPSEEWLRIAWAEKMRLEGTDKYKDLPNIFMNIDVDKFREDYNSWIVKKEDGAEPLKIVTANWEIAEQLYRLAQSIGNAALSLPIDDGLKDELQKAIDALTKALDKVMFAVDKKGN